jgi:ATP-dependent DNA helicase RecG
MTIDELNKILLKGEDVHTEYKQSRSKAPDNLYESVCAFLNREGGIVILGADDSGKVTGINTAFIEQIKKDIVTSLNNKDIVNPPVNFPIYELTIGVEKLLCIKIPVSSQVHTCHGIIFDRENDSDIRILDESRKAEMYFRKRQDFSENIIYPAMTINDLDPALFDKARTLLRAVNPEHPWLSMDNMAILRSALFYRKDLKTAEEGFTLAAALMFGKDVTIQSILPAYKIEAMVRRENTDRWDDRLTLRTNLIDTYQLLMAFVRKHLDNKFYLEGDTRKDLRDMIFREIVANIIVHREYTNGFSTDFIIYKNAVEITNPNKTLFRGPLSPDTFSPYAKNPNIRRFFNEFRWTDEIGSGVRNVYKYLNVYANGSKPLFIEDDMFKTIIPLHRYTLGNNAQPLIEFIGLKSKTIGNERIQKLQDITIDYEIAQNTNVDELLFNLGCTWHKKGVNLENVRFLIDNHLSLADFKKELSFEQKGVKFLKKRGKNILGTLIYVLSAATLDELSDFMEFKSKNSFRDNYIKPLKDNELISLINPKSPNNPNQQYTITEKGLLFLGGL